MSDLKQNRGRVTIPTDVDVVPETLELLERWGADAIRDCDGTDYPEQLKSVDAKVYSTYYTTRKDNAWAKANPDEVQQCYIMTGFYTASQGALSIPLMKGISPELMQVNTRDDIKRWWEVMDRTTGQPVPADQWRYDEESGCVVLDKPEFFHDYTVSFLAYLIWDPVHMYNAVTNDWKDFEHQITFDVRQPKTHKFTMERLRKFIAEHPYVNVIRYTTFFHQFTLVFDELKREKYVDWYGYSASVSPFILEQFEKEVGYKFRPEFIIDQGYYNNQYRIPSKEFKDFMAFQRREVAKLAKEMGLLTVAIVTSPLAVEGKIRYEQAFRGIEELRQNTDSLLIINNENILEIYGRLSLKQAFGKADDILASAAKGIAEIITVESDLVNVDFADVSKVMRNSGRAHMAVATADGDKRAEAVAEASLRSPLLDHNLISGAKNILLNISVSDADALMYEEVVQILEYIQAHASVQDDNGVIHNANIIWGTSEKPQLGNFIELVVVATGFEGDAQPGVMKQIIPPVRTVEPAVKETSAAAPVLEPIKPLPPKPAQRQPELVMLGAKPTRYSNIDTLLAKPAYQSRNSKFIVRVPGSRKEVLKDDTTDAQAQKEESQGGSLFD